LHVEHIAIERRQLRGFVRLDADVIDTLNHRMFSSP
jgi:hypothetical protein